MAHDKDEIIALALEKIESEQCVTIEEVVLELPICKKTFYNWSLHELPEIKSAIEAEKVKVKKMLRRKWRNSDNPALQIAEYKLISTDDELNKLNTHRVKTDLTITKPGISVSFGAEADDTNQGD